MTPLEHLWIDHVVWTRQAIVSLLANLPDAPAATNRLIANQRQLADAIEGKPAPGLAALFVDHIRLAVQVVQAAAAHDATALQTATHAWTLNAIAIANRLAYVTNRSGWDTMMLDHLRLTTNEALARIDQRWTDDVAAFDAVLTQAIAMARMSSVAVV